MSKLRSKITEPMTMITDYLLGFYILYLAIKLFLMTSIETQFSSFLYGFSFLATAIGAFLGGTSHGFKEIIGKKVNNIVWQFTIYTIGTASMFFLIGSTLALVTNELVRLFLYGFAVIKFLIFIWWTTRHEEFLYVVLDYIPSMFIVIIMMAISYFYTSNPASPWIIIGILVAFLGAAVQVSGFSIHKHFNHNDIYHGIQGIAMYLIYRGALFLQDVTVSS